MEKSHYSCKTKSSSVTWRHVGLYNRCRSENHELICKKATRRRSTYLYIVPNSLNDPRIIIFIATRSQMTPGKTIPSVVKHQLKVLVPCEYQLGVPARGGWRERVTESDMFDMCSRVCDMQSVSWNETEPRAQRVEGGKPKQ